MKKWLIDQLKAAAILVIIIAPCGLANTLLCEYLLEH